jgi:ATP-dependent RNA circularization protein (DNA/RNA ligase family)
MKLATRPVSSAMTSRKELNKLKMKHRKKLRKQEIKSMSYVRMSNKVQKIPRRRLRRRLKDTAKM